MPAASDKKGKHLKLWPNHEAPETRCGKSALFRRHWTLTNYKYRRWVAARDRRQRNEKHQDIQTVDEAGSFVTDTNLIKYKIFSLLTFSITGMEVRVEKDLQVWSNLVHQKSKTAPSVKNAYTFNVTVYTFNCMYCLWTASFKFLQKMFVLNSIQSIQSKALSNPARASCKLRQLDCKISRHSVSVLYNFL